MGRVPSGETPGFGVSQTGAEDGFQSSAATRQSSQPLDLSGMLLSGKVQTTASGGSTEATSQCDVPLP